MNWFFTQARCADATPAAPLGTPPGSAVSAAVPPKKTDFMELPLPVKYEELQREIMMSLKADHFEGGRFDFNKQLNQKFFLSHSVHMGALEVPAQGNQIIKIPNATYEFGANVVDTNYMLVGRVLTDGRVSGRLKYDFTGAECQAADEQGARVLAGDGGSGLQGARLAGAAQAGQRAVLRRQLPAVGERHAEPGRRGFLARRPEESGVDSPRGTPTIRPWPPGRWPPPVSCPSPTPPR